MTRIVITFVSTHQALKAEKLFKKVNIKNDLIPTPREISSECGFSLLSECLVLQGFINEIDKYNLEFDKIYKIEGNNGEVKYEEID